MCFHNSLAVNATALCNRYNAKLAKGYVFEPIYHVSAFANPIWPILTNLDLSTLQPFCWGLIPSNIKDEMAAFKIRTMTYNARLETLEKKPSFRGLLATKRCLIPSTGFFEWQQTTGQKIPWYIFLPKHKLFSIAGIWTFWKQPSSGKNIYTFSIITIPAHGMIQTIHNINQRMPFILHPDVEHYWLKREFTQREMKYCLNAIADLEFDAYTVSKKIIKKNFNTNIPEILHHFPYQSLF